MKLKLNFTNPLLVSAYFDKDLLNVQILKNGFFFSVLDYTYIEENYTMTAKVIPPLLDSSDYSTWSTQMVTALLFFSLAAPMMMMCCLNVGMGRTWSLFFMLQLLTNFDNFGEVKFPANVQFFMSALNDISNFDYSEIEFLRKLMKGDWFFGQDGLVFGIVVYFVVLVITWSVWKNWPKKSSHLRKMVIWSPILRLVMMLWFTACLWNMSYFEGLVNKNFATKNYDLENPKVKGKQRLLVGLETRYPTGAVSPDHDLSSFFKALLTTSILVAFPVISFIWLQVNFEFLDFVDIRIKFGTLYTDIKPHNKAAKEQITLLCLRRFMIVLATVFLN